MGLLDKIFGDKQAEREHQERMAKIKSDLEITINKQDNNAKKTTSLFDNVGKCGEAYFNGDKKQK